jgi:hypothetical protein
MTSSEQRLFKLLDDYSRRHHQCFVAEMFLNEERTEFILCFRSVHGDRNAPARYASRYLRVEIAEAEIAGQANVLTTSVSAMLDKELATLGRSQ